MINKLLLIISFSTFLAGGQIQYVFDLDFKGNQELSTVHLKDKIRLKARGFFSKSEFSQKKLHLDEITLKNYYQTLGYIDVSISSSYKIFQNTDVNIEFIIKEGHQYHVKGIEYDGAKIFSNKEIEDIIDVKSNDIYNPAKLRKNLKVLKYKYLQAGKINISIVEDITFDNNNMFIQILISEGITYFIRKTQIVGLELVNSKYIQRELLYSDGMIYNVKTINSTREQIFESGLFSSVEIQPQIVDSSEIDLIINLREYKFRDIISEIGFEQLPSTEGDLPISAINGKLQWKIGHLFNTASRMRFEGEIGISYASGESFMRQYYEVYYTSPWLINIRTPINFKIYFENIEQNEKLIRLGINTSFNYFYSNKTRFWGNLKTEFITSGDIEEAEERSINIFFSKYSISNHISPKNGYFLSLNPSLHGTFLGGNFHYVKIDSEFKYYITILNKIILANRVKLGWLSEFSSYMDDDVEIPSFNKFHLGGQTSLRGWYSSNDFEPEPSTGGNVRYLFNSEIRFPLYARLGGELFFDVGSLRDSDSPMLYDWDAGFGLTINTGLGPARIDAAYKRAVGKPTILFSLLYMF